MNSEVKHFYIEVATAIASKRRLRYFYMEKEGFEPELYKVRDPLSGEDILLEDFIDEADPTQIINFQTLYKAKYP